VESMGSEEGILINPVASFTNSTSDRDIHIFFKTVTVYFCVCDMESSLMQELTNYDPWTKSYLWPVLLLPMN
jgi:hypothetical protein